jgi:hypothetical protein
VSLLAIRTQKFPKITVGLRGDTSARRTPKGGLPHTVSPRSARKKESPHFFLSHAHAHATIERHPSPAGTGSLHRFADRLLAFCNRKLPACARFATANDPFAGRTKAGPRRSADAPKARRRARKESGSHLRKLSRLIIMAQFCATLTAGASGSGKPSPHQLQGHLATRPSKYAGICLHRFCTDFRP